VFFLKFQTNKLKSPVLIFHLYIIIKKSNLILCSAFKELVFKWADPDQCSHFIPYLNCKEEKSYESKEKVKMLKIITENFDSLLNKIIHDLF